MSHHLYRHFDADGTLLYIGTSLSAISRLGGHLHSSEWFPSIASVSVQRFDSKAVALNAEREAIRTEHPLHNVMFTNRAPHHRRPPSASSERYNATVARRAAARRSKMIRLRDKGLTLREIGRRFGGITAQRVCYILKRGT